MKISYKQSLIAQTIRERRKKQLFLIGSLGTSKTFGAAVAMISVGIHYPGSVIIVARKNMTELRAGTLFSFHEAAEEMNFTKFKETENKILKWEFDNGSVIMFRELDHTKDRQFSKVKSINATCAMIDEADGIVHEAYIALFSRTGRKNKNNAPDFILSTCNPNEAWLKSEVYDKWQAPEQYGPLPEDVAVIEFETHDSFLGPAYYDRFANMPRTWKERYLFNNWNYGDDDASLFKYRHMDRQHVDTIASALRYVGYDVARGGKDRSVLAMFEGNTLVDIRITKDRDEIMDTADQAELLKEFARDNLVGYENIGVDAVGLGVGVVDHAKKLDMYVHEFISGASSTETVLSRDKKEQSTEMVRYSNKRSEMAHKLALALENGEVFLYSGCPFLSEFKKEATMHNYKIEDKLLALEPKEKVKERLGHSPDIFDAVIMAYERYLNSNGSAGTLPMTGSNRAGMSSRHSDRRGRRGIMNV